MTQKKKKIDDLIEKVYDFSAKHWILYSFIIFLPSIWFPIIINLWGQNLGLAVIINNRTNLTTAGWFFTILLFTLVFITLVLNSSKSHSNKAQIVLNNRLKHVEYNNEILKYILASIYKLCGNKYARFINYIDEEKDSKTIDPFMKITQPQSQLKDILNEISNCFYKITGISTEDITITLAYRILNNDWVWSEGSDTAADLSDLKFLTTNPKTTFYNILNGEDKYLFFNSKKEAEKNFQYVFDDKDKMDERDGSIVCKQIYAGKHNEKYIDAILTISTYGEKLVRDQYSDNIDNVKDTVRDIILKQYEKRIVLELSLIYIKYLYEKTNL